MAANEPRGEERRGEGARARKRERKRKGRRLGTYIQHI